MMKRKALNILGACILVFAACTNNQANKKLEGKWQSKDGATKLEITDKSFIMNEDGKPVAEDYFVKEDTIFSSYQGARPYTRWYIRNLDEHKLTLFYPDSDIVEFTR